MTHVDENEKRRLDVYTVSNCLRYARDLLYTGDGLFILRIKNFEECENVEMSVTYRDKNIKGSPFCIKELIPEHCKCPKKLENVMESLKCPSTIKQIDLDLRPFKNLDFREIKKEIKRRFNNFRTSSLCNYVIKSNKVYRKCYGAYTGFKMFMDAMLISLTNKAKLPDLEFFINLGDWPLVKKSPQIIPIFSWCGSTETLDIVLPTYDLTESVLNAMHRVTLDMLSVQKEQWKWHDKVEKAFFRGRDSRRERLELIDIARYNPSLFNASITNFFFFTNEAERYGPKAPHISFIDFFKYKYQISIDGTVAAYRLPYLLAGNSVVLKQDSPYYEHFYHSLQKFKHYVPFHRDPKLDLVQKVKWLRTNDDQAKKIMENGRDFVRKNLMPSNIFCYYLLALQVTFSKLGALKFH